MRVAAAAASLLAALVVATCGGRSAPPPQPCVGPSTAQCDACLQSNCPNAVADEARECADYIACTCADGGSPTSCPISSDSCAAAFDEVDFCSVDDCPNACGLDTDAGAADAGGYSDAASSPDGFDAGPAIVPGTGECADGTACDGRTSYCIEYYLVYPSGDGGVTTFACWPLPEGADPTHPCASQLGNGYSDCFCTPNGPFAFENCTDY